MTAPVSNTLATTTPDAGSVTVKKARTRKPRAKPPAAPKVERARKPRRSLIATIDAMGPTHMLAYRALAAGDKTWPVALAHALGARERVEKALAEENRARAAFDRAAANHAEAILNMKAGAAFLKQLDDLARQIAHARGEVPAVETPTPLLDPDGRDEGAET